MDYPDTSDILFENKFIPEPELDVTPDLKRVEEYRKYYEQELEKYKEKQVIRKIEKIELDETHDDENLINNNPFILNKDIANLPFKRYKREKITLVSVDSRDRNKLIYPHAHEFKIFLGRTFYNVKKVRLISIEFPNTNAVINNSNNYIYWRNQEDVLNDETVNKGGVIAYPIYSAKVRNGSYIATTLQTEMAYEMNLVKRSVGVNVFHFFIASLDQNTDIVTFTGLKLRQLSANAFKFSSGSNQVQVLLANHGFTLNQKVYIYGVKPAGGIDSTVLSGFHIITSIIDQNSFKYEVNVQATIDVAGGGGSTASVGVEAPFQFLWGESTKTIAPNIGYPLENSSQQIFTNIQKMENIFQMLIITDGSHGLGRSWTYINKTIDVGQVDPGTGLFIPDSSFTILDIPTTSTILVQINTTNIPTTLTSNPALRTIRFVSGPINIVCDVLSYTLYNVDMFMVTTQSNHNYVINDINKVISIFNTVNETIVSDINYDGDYTILQVPSTTLIVLGGVLTDVKNNIGNIPRHGPLTVYTHIISNIVYNYMGISNKVQITCVTQHNLEVGDSIFIYNLLSNPTINSYLKIISVETDYIFVVECAMISYTTDLSKGETYIGTGLMTLSFPSHGFNSIIQYTNGPNAHQITIQMQFDHNLNVNDIIRLSNTNTVPSLNMGNLKVITVISSDTIVIENNDITNPLAPLTTIPIIATGYTGLDRNFYLYGSTDVGGIPSTYINGKLHSVREIIDVDTFTFMISGTFSTVTEIGGGGENLYLSSLIHGFEGVQTNTKNKLLNRSINLEGENYCFMTCPQLATILNTGNVNDVFARIILDQAPGYVNFNFLSNPKIFDITPLSKLSELEFTIRNYDNTFYDFIDLDYSFTLEITEMIDQTSMFNVSSRRGVVDVDGSNDYEVKDNNDFKHQQQSRVK